MSYHLLSAILRSSWAIDDRFAFAHGSIVASLLNGQLPANTFGSTENSKSLPYLICEDPEEESGKPIADLSSVNSESIAVIPVLGPLMKADQDECDYFNAGMETLGNRVVDADNNPNISGIILYIDSPGGTVDGTQAFADKVKSCKKPVVAFVDGCMASAALWIGTSANIVIAQNSTTEIGSIGVMVAFADMEPMWQAEGIKIHRIMADQSADKNKPVLDAMAGNYKTIKDRELNPLADMFISAVKTNRPNLPDSVFTGKMFFAEEALSLGLIDSIGNFQSAVDTAYTMAKKDPHKPKCTFINPNISTMNFPLLIALLQLSAIEATEDGIFLNLEQIQAIEDGLKANAVQVQNLISAHQTSLDDANQRASAAETALSAAEDLRTSAENSRSEAISSLDEIHPNIAAAQDIHSKVQAIRTILSNKTGSSATGIQSKNDPAAKTDGVDWETLNALPHMQEHY
jgi:protease-4